MINNFWAWIVQSTNSALSLLNNYVYNSTTGPFMSLLLVVILFAALMHFLIKPLIGFTFASVGKSDRVKKDKNTENKAEVKA